MAAAVASDGSSVVVEGDVPDDDEGQDIERVQDEGVRETDRAVNAEREEGEMVGTVTFVYNHHVRQLTDILTEFQHQNYGAVIASLHVHLDAENCLEVLVVRGKSGEIRRIADKLIGTKGVKHGKLTLTTAGSDLT